MKRFLTKVTETYRLENEAVVEEFLKELKTNPQFEVAKYTSTKKYKKSKGEIIDEWIRFEVTKVFNEEAEPDSIIDINYTVDSLVKPNVEAIAESEEDIDDEYAD